MHSFNINDYMKTNDREILLYFDPQSSPHKKTVAYAKSMVSHVQTYAFAQTPSTGVSWRQILKSMNKHPKELLNKALPEYQKTIKGREFTMEGWLKVLQYNTHLLKAPIAVRGNRAILCESPTDIFKLHDVAIEV